MSRWLISVPVWGDAFLAKFIAMTLPALQLAAMGIPAELERLLIVPTDRPNEIGRRSTEVLPIKTLPIIALGAEPNYVYASLAHRQVIETAVPGDIVTAVVADMVVSANTFSNCHDFFKAGKKIILLNAIRAREDCGRSPYENSRQLSEFAWRYRHDITRNSTWPGVTGGYELSRIYFDGGDDVVARVWVLNPQAFVVDGRPLSYAHTEDLVTNFQPDEIQVVTDPDQMAAMELGPCGKTLPIERPISERLYEHRLPHDIFRWVLSHRIVVRGRDVDLGDAEIVAPLLNEDSQ